MDIGLQQLQTGSQLRFYITAPASEKDAKRLGVQIGEKIRKQDTVKLCDKSARYAIREDLKEPVAQHLENINKRAGVPTGSITNNDYLEECYFPRGAE